MYKVFFGVLILVWKFTINGITQEREKAVSLVPEKEAFRNLLIEQCGQTYRGTVSKAITYYEEVVVEPEELIIHFLTGEQ